MKHLSQINIEFAKLAVIKEANWWQQLTQQEKKNYLMMHPGSQLPYKEDVEYEHPDPDIGKVRGKLRSLKNRMFKILDERSGENVLVPENAVMAY